MKVDQAFFDLEVRSMCLEAAGVMSLTLRDPTGAALPEWVPGAHIDLMLQNGVLRQYSLCSDPSERGQWRVGVLREVAGRGGSAYVHDELRPGDTVRVRVPRNNFSLVPASAYLFVAGGIGITPLLPMVREATVRKVPWRLIYLGRSRAGMAFLPELEALAAQGGELTVHASDEAGRYPLDLLLADTMAADPALHLYTCGPPQLLAALTSSLEAVTATGAPTGTPVDPARFHVERFVADPLAEPGTTAATGDSGAGVDEGFIVEIADGTEIEVPAGRSILESLELAGLNPLNSCREGICGTCETSVISGEIDHRDSLLSDDERAAGDTMMICVSRCRGRRLVLDFE
ncbi:MAG: PDR/VanB family oxidoreductase [Leifsonia sp.]